VILFHLFILYWSSLLTGYNSYSYDSLDKTHQIVHTGGILWKLWRLLAMSIPIYFHSWITTFMFVKLVGLLYRGFTPFQMFLLFISRWSRRSMTGEELDEESIMDYKWVTNIWHIRLKTLYTCFWCRAIRINILYYCPIVNVTKVLSLFYCKYRPNNKIQWKYWCLGLCLI